MWKIDKIQLIFLASTNLQVNIVLRILASAKYTDLTLKLIKRTILLVKVLPKYS